jgi:hypothetical protein
VAPIGELANQVDATGVVVLDHDRELLTAGDPPAAVDCRSIRKPLLPGARQPQLAGPGPVRGMAGPGRIPICLASSFRLACPIDSAMLSLAEKDLGRY